MNNEWIKKLINDKDGHPVVWQWPNAPLSIWICLTVANFFVHGRFHMALSFIATLALLLWAVVEIGWGQSLFRRLFGGVVLVGMLVGLAMKLLN